MIIPYTLIEPETLNNLIEEFVSRDGTDNGFDQSLPDRVNRVMAALKSGEMVLVFDQESQTPNILPKETVQDTSGQQ